MNLLVEEIVVSSEVAPTGNSSQRASVQVHNMSSARAHWRDAAVRFVGMAIHTNNVHVTQGLRSTVEPMQFIRLTPGGDFELGWKFDEAMVIRLH